MKNKEKVIGSILLTTVIVIFFTIGTIINLRKYNSREANNIKINNIEDIFEENKSQLKEQSTEIIVEIRGAVEKEGTYYLNTDSRLQDLIKIAGGFKGNVDMQRVPSLASKLKDEELIYIPLVGEIIDDKLLYVSDKEENSIININTASKEKLMTIPGIGAVTAQKIIDYREKEGLFKVKEDIKKVNRIGDKTFDNIKDYFDVK